MKLVTSTRFEPEQVVTPAEAVTYVAQRAEDRGEGTKERMRLRAEAVEGMLGRLMTALVDSGVLRHRHQIEALFDYDVAIEE